MNWLLLVGACFLGDPCEVRALSVHVDRRACFDAIREIPLEERPPAGHVFDCAPHPPAGRGAGTRTDPDPKAGGHPLMTAPYLSDRQRIERALPARMVWHVAASIWDGVAKSVDPQGLEQISRIVSQLEASLNASLVDLDDGDRFKLARRLYRACELVTYPLRDRPVATALVAARELVFTLITEGMWEMDPEFDAAWDALAAAIYERDENAELLDAVDRSGTRYGRKALATLQAAGYYRRPAGGCAA